jgi:hypothetical protein
MVKWRYSSIILGFGIRWRCGQLHAPAALPPEERSTGNYWIGGWVGRVEMRLTPGIMTHIPIFMTIVSGIQVILRLISQQLARM